jgi:hypothetical protein
MMDLELSLAEAEGAGMTRLAPELRETVIELAGVACRLDDLLTHFDGYFALKSSYQEFDHHMAPEERVAAEVALEYQIEHLYQRIKQLSAELDGPALTLLKAV